jgi:serine/threonine protein kinase
LQTLQETELCHRNLTLDVIARDGDHVDICQLGWALRYSKKDTVLHKDRPLPLPSGLNPQYIAPEYFSSTRGGWNGFSADLWATGLLLYSMVVGSDALFTAPIAEDTSFFRLCIKGDIRGQAKRYGKIVGKDFSGLSDELVDLLKHMLRADPESRLSLEQVMVHPWLIMDEVMTPTHWIAQNRPEMSSLLGGVQI